MQGVKQGQTTRESRDAMILLGPWFVVFLIPDLLLIYLNTIYRYASSPFHSCCFRPAYSYSTYQGTSQQDKTQISG